MTIETHSPKWLIADIQNACPDAPAQTIRRCLTLAMQEFADAGMVQPWINVPTQAGVESYQLDDLLPEGYRIHSIVHVEWCGCCIEHIQDCVPCPTGYEMDDMHMITLHGGYVPCTNGTDDLRVKVNLRVSNENCDIPRDMERWEKHLRMGVQAHLLGQKGQKWFDYNLSQEYMRKFKGCIASAQCLMQQNMRSSNGFIRAECVL